ncbi:hypothetical protein PVK06_035503 [Gossypium arboreum]|uniref:Uncharacterized protein n=1 Tax=Gossypium arboreum TaxID=29729 RepID=A0ABR0NJ41_GOSAR|nr:hypothetical protein PVK06_035503 [Gossypium arboreum]
MTFLPRFGWPYQRFFSGSAVSKDAKLKTQLKEFKDDFKYELRSELHNLFEQYFGNLTPAATNTIAQVKDKGILGGAPLRFAPKDPLRVLIDFQTKSL